MHMRRYFLFVLIIAGLSATSVHAQTPDVAMISADELKAKLAGNQPVMIIDVRGSESYAAATHTIKGAIHFKTRKLQARLAYSPLKNPPKDPENVNFRLCPTHQSRLPAAAQ